MGTYCNLSDIRDEGFTEEAFSDSRVNAAIVLATEYINRITGQWFEARVFDEDAPYEANGDGTPLLVLPIPIISVSKVELVCRGAASSDILELDADQYVVFNRHMNGQVSGGDDDRHNPRIIMAEALQGNYIGQGRYRQLLLEDRPTFPLGPRTVRITGTFGYTDPDDGYYYSGTGITPPLIKQACKLLVVRELETMRKQTRRATAQQYGRIVQATTKDQSYRLAERLQQGWATGDQEIDSLLTLYTRNGSVGSA